MKKVSTLLLCTFMFAASYSQIYSNPQSLSPVVSSPALNVGIGTNRPSAGLHILSGGGRNRNSSIILERDDIPLSNQKNKLSIILSSSSFPAAYPLPGGSCSFILSNPYNISSMAFSTIPSKPQMVLKTNGNFGINTINPTHKLQVHDGALMLSGAVANFGGPQLLFSDNLTTHPNGRWAIEYVAAEASRPSMGGLNFWQPFPNQGSAGNYSLFLKDDGKIGMGVSDDNTSPNFCSTNATNSGAFPAGYRLYVKGGILTDKVKVAVFCSTQWADYVFAEDYKLKSLDEVEEFTKTNKHLPGVPSADDIVKNGGIDVNEMFAKQMEKIEELTLYLIQLKNELKELKNIQATTNSFK